MTPRRSYGAQNTAIPGADVPLLKNHVQPEGWQFVPFFSNNFDNKVFPNMCGCCLTTLEGAVAVEHMNSRPWPHGMRDPGSSHFRLVTNSTLIAAFPQVLMQLDSFDLPPAKHVENILKGFAGTKFSFDEFAIIMLRLAAR